MCFSCICLFVLYVLVYVLSALPLGVGLAAVWDCSTPWTVPLTFSIHIWFYCKPETSLMKEILISISISDGAFSYLSL